MQKLNKKFDIFIAKLSAHQYGGVYFITCIFFFICTGTVIYNIFFNENFNFQSCKSALAISGIFNLLIVVIFLVKINDIVKEVKEKDYSLDGIKRNNKLLHDLSKNYLALLLKEAIKKEEYKIAHLISRQIDKLNGGIKI